MAISEFWVGEIPSKPLPIQIVDSDNNPMVLNVFSGFKVRLLGSDNEEIDVTDIVLNMTGTLDGVLTMRWPTNRSLFNKPGEYLLQLQLEGPNGTKEFTDAHTIRVREFGGKN